MYAFGYLSPRKSILEESPKAKIKVKRLSDDFEGIELLGKKGKLAKAGRNIHKVINPNILNETIQQLQLSGRKQSSIEAIKPPEVAINPAPMESWIGISSLE